MKSTTSKENKEAPEREYSESLARGLSVLLSFNEDRSQQSLSDIARVVQLPKASVQRALNTLRHLGFVEQDGRLYRVTTKILQFATTYLASTRLPALAQPVCARVAKQVLETCAMAIRDDDHMLIVAKHEPRGMMPILPAIGYRLPSVSTSLGRAMLAQLSEDEVSALLASGTIPVLTPHTTPYTLTEPEAIRAAIDRARQNGYAIADQEIELGLRSIAVPVFHFSGAVVGSIYIGGRVERCPMERLTDEFLPLLREASAELTTIVTDLF